MHQSKYNMTTHRPRLLLAYVESATAAQTARYFRRHGWEVHLAASAAETYRLVQELDPQTIIIDTELPDESGWLICAKLTLTSCASPVFLITPALDDSGDERAASVGAAAIFTRSQCVPALTRDLLGSQLARAV